MPLLIGTTASCNSPYCANKLVHEEATPHQGNGKQA